MSQTRIGSLLEATVNLVVGFSINWLCNVTILPLFGFAITGGQAFEMRLVFTVISLSRQYVLRRLFNGIKGLHHGGR